MHMYDPCDKSNPVYIEVADQIGYLVLNRPDKRNALTVAMWQALPRLLALLDDNPQVRVITVCSSQPEAFCAGADIDTFRRVAGDPAAREENRLAIRDGQRALARTEKPTIARISGACIGAGCGIAIHCDLRFASSDSRFGITPAKLGLVYPLNDTKQLMDLVGPSEAKKLLFTARLIDAEEALRVGLVDDIFPPDRLDAETAAFASDMASRSQYALRGMKKSIRRIMDGQTDDDAETARWFQDAHSHDDYHEGVAAFFEKRAPNFSWNGD